MLASLTSATQRADFRMHYLVVGSSRNSNHGASFETVYLCITFVTILISQQDLPRQSSLFVSIKKIKITFMYHLFKVDCVSSGGNHV